MNQTTSYSIDDAKGKMAKYCAYQERCHWEVENRMNQYGLIPEVKDIVLMFLMKENFLNEGRYVESYIRGKINQKKWGRVKIGMELKRRKINKRMIEEGFKNIDLEKYHSNLEYLIHKRVGEETTSLSYNERGKLMKFLMQKGYEYSLIKEKLEDLFLKEF